MRDVQRLDGFYEELKRVHKEYLPDWRFGQFVYNLQDWVMKNRGCDTFYFEVRIYFTFGDHPQFPFGREDYVVSEGLDKRDAIAKFRMRHPDVTDGILNCAFYYSEDEFDNIRKEFYSGRKPAEVIT